MKSPLTPEIRTLTDTMFGPIPLMLMKEGGGGGGGGGGTAV